jgi:hypothetical protein
LYSHLSQRTYSNQDNKKRLHEKEKMKEHDSPFSVVLYEADAPTAWLPSGGDIEAPPWERCFAQFLRQIYDRSRSEKSVRDYRRTLFAFFASSAQGGPPKHPEDYTREDVEDFLHRLSSSSRSKGQAPSVATMNQRLRFDLYHHRTRRPPANFAPTAQPNTRLTP